MHALADLTQEIQASSQFLSRLWGEVAKTVVGQKILVERLVLALIAEGHVLLEGVPGLAKTTAVKAVASSMDVKFARIQFTPDLLPADVVGTEIYRPQSGQFEIKKGPIFANLLLADEINRAPAKVQSALLEAMQERQVTLADNTFALPQPFVVLATQNPIEQEGTYSLPEAQVDRFMLKVRVGYPSKSEEKEIMRRMASRQHQTVDAVVTPKELAHAKEVADAVYMDGKIEDYLVDLVFASRDPAAHGLPALEALIEYGASPRASIALAQAAKVYAFLQGRGYVTPQDVKTIGPEVLRHRIGLTYEAEAQDKTSDDIVAEIFNTIAVP